MIDYYTEVDISKLPSKGLFYDNDLSIMIRGANPYEIEKYDLSNHSSYDTINQDIYSLLSSTVIVSDSKKRRSILEIIDVDKHYLVIMIRDLTEGQNEIIVHPDNGTAFDAIKLCAENIELQEPDDFLNSHYSEYYKCYYFDTEFGDYYFSPPTFGLHNSLFEQMKNRIFNKKTYDKDFISVMQTLNRNNYNVSISEIDEMEANFFTMDRMEYLTIKTISDKVISSFGVRRLTKIIDGKKYNSYFDIFKNPKIFKKIQ